MFIDRPDDPRTPSSGSAAPAVDRLAEIARLSVDIARLEGERMVQVAAHVAEVRDCVQRPTSLDQLLAADLPARSAFAEINLVLHESGRYADDRIGQACALATLLPRTLAAVCAGQITRYRALIILKHTMNLSDDERALAEERALAVAASLTPAKLSEKTRRIVARINPDAVHRRRKQAREQRHISVQPAADGMARFIAYVSAEKAHAAFGLADALAREATTPDDQRSIDERRADAFYELMCGPQDATKRVHWQAQILIPVGTVLGLNGEPGHLPGYGPIPAEMCQELAADATWRRILTDPATNTTLDIAPKRYRPGARLSEFIHFRDKTCRWPGCNRTRVEIDHTIRREDGGLTVQTNLGDFCKAHHQLKDAPGWKVVQETNGVFTFITPHGRAYRTYPPGADGEVKPVETIEISKPPPKSDGPPPF
jgi:Domain of unknown function (DUF222)